MSTGVDVPNVQHGNDDANSLSFIYKRKRTLFLIFLLVQAPVVYLLYSAEITQGVLDRYTKWSNSSGSILIAGRFNNFYQKLGNHASPTEVTNVGITTSRRINNNSTKSLNNLNTTLLVTSAASDPSSTLPTCPKEPPDLQGPLAISFSHNCLSHDEIKKNNPLVQNGGHFVPPYCTASCKVAIIIPYRNREEHLSYFLEYMHPILQRQLLDYRIFIINQYAPFKFNRAKLMNVGYAEAIKDYDFQCFVFHDVDLILENDKAIYACTEQPRICHRLLTSSTINYPMKPFSVVSPC